MSERRNAVVPTIVAAVAAIAVLAIVILPSFGSGNHESDSLTGGSSDPAADTRAGGAGEDEVAHR